jgi:large subunit ribosomal protein L18
MKRVVRKIGRQRRHLRLRQDIAGTLQRPRLSVMVSNQHMYVQLIDDERGVTIGSVSSCGKSAAAGGNLAGAKLLGQRIAELAKAQGVECIVFDRGGYRYHGRIKALADAAREAGLKF